MITNTALIAEHIIQGVAGSSNDIMEYINTCIEEGDFSQESFFQHEMEIMNLVDDAVFQCEACGWTLSMNELEDNGTCSDCWEEEND